MKPINASGQVPNAPMADSSHWLPATLSSHWTYVLMGIAILLLDVMTGTFLMFPILFVIPVTLAAWYCGLRCAAALAVLLPLGRFFIAAFFEMPAPILYTAVNGLVRAAVLGFIAILVSRTARQTAELDRRVRMLEGILPICGFCKAIRDDQGQWTQLESYITHRSEAMFSHSVCPKCMKIHYPDFLPPERDA